MGFWFKKNSFLLLLLIGFLTGVYGQDYRAMNGSSYAGSLGVGNNPASIVHMPFVWDITPLALQLKYSTNSMTVKNSSYLSPSRENTEVVLNNGQYKSFVMANLDMKLLNVSVRLRDKAAIAFGLSFRSYLSVNTSSLLFRDTVIGVRGFMKNNIDNISASADGRGHGWVELFGTYAKSVIDNSNEILNVGVTVKSNMGIGGGYITGIGITEMPGLVNGKSGYYLKNGLLNYGLSANMDVLDSSSDYSSSKKEFFQRTFSTLGLSLGAEYIRPSNVEGNGYEYDLKLGVSIMDLAYNKFQYSGYSRTAILDKANVSDSLIDVFLDNISDVASLADSLDIISGSNSPNIGNFKIFQPARIVINADKHISGNFFINGELTIPLYAVLGKKKLVARDMNFINLSARIETKKFGLYFPVSLNNKMHLWFGSAFRVGTFLFGVHNLASVFGSNKIQDGGAYLAFTLRIKDKIRYAGDTGLNFSGRALKQLKCPPPVF